MTPHERGSMPAKDPRYPRGVGINRSFTCPLCHKTRPTAGRHARFLDGLKSYVCWRHPRAPLAGIRS